MEHIDYGLYRLLEGETATDVALKVYGDVHKVRRILEANPGEWAAGDRIKVPGFTGTLVIARAGEQFPTLHRRVLNNPAATQAVKDAYFKWNGRLEVQEGDEVFFQDLRRVSYGY